MITEEHRRARACAELQRGAPVAMIGEASAALIASVETLSDEVLAAVTAAPVSDPSVCVTHQRAKVLHAPAYDGDLARIALRREWAALDIRAIADPTYDLDHPMQGPHRPLRGGDAGLHRAAIHLCKIARLLPAALVAPFVDRGAAERFAIEHDLVRVGASLSPPVAAWREVVAARVPIATTPTTLLRVFRREIWADEHYALEIGHPSRDAPVLTRLHSACITGDLFGSLKCDCGAQLQGAIDRIGRHGSGVLLYLMQEGRGIGLANKMRAYRLQDQGFDTVEANHRLGFEDDERMLADGAAILAAMGFRRAKVLTNNPRKLSAFAEAGVEVVERVPLVVGANPQNAAYLRVKARKSGHLL